MKVLQVNVNLQNGGAAAMATDLHHHLLQLGVESKFSYGWGEKGGKSSIETDVQHSFQVGNRLQVASNILIHRMIGIDLLLPSSANLNNLIDAIQKTLERLEGSFALGIIFTALFYVKSIYDKRRLNSLINS